MVRIGIAGIGFMGVTHYKAVQQVEGAQVAAIFTRNPKKLAGDWQNVRGNFGDAGGVQDLTGVRKHSQLEAILDDPEIDLLDICLPSHMHKEVALAALARGKHVLVEKPIALCVEDADEMVAAARKAGRLLMVGQVLRFFPEFALLKDLVESGQYGRLVGAHLKRVISRPNWSDDNWFSDPTKTGGAVIDLHIHDTDFVQHLFGMPSAVFATGIVSPDGQVDYLVTQYLFDGRNLCITAQSGAASMQGVPFEHGYDAYFERATLRYNSLTGQPIHCALEDGSVETITPEKPDAFVAELQTAVEGVRTGRLPAILSGESARNSLALCLREAESVQKRQTVRLETA
jgi:predicted dehydrogenase